MKKISPYLVWLCMSIFLLTGCSEKVPESLNGIADIDVSDEVVNQKITLTPYSRNNLVKNNDSIWLTLENVSNDTVEFQSDFGISVFVYKNKNWVEIENYSYYVFQNSSTYKLFPSNGDPFKTQSITVSPYYSDLEHKLPCRIIVSGLVINSDSNGNEITYSYIDVVLKP